MRYYIGIDGGGTKTAICAASEDGSYVRHTKTIGSSWRAHGASGVARNLRENVEGLMCGEYDKIDGIVMGLPCYGESVEGDDAVGQAVREAFDGIPIYLTNDVEVGWAGSLGLAPGINVVAGTGSIAFGKDAYGKTARSGGWGEFFGDEGSCYWIGHKVTGLFSKQSDGRMPKDELYEVVYSEFGIKSDFEFIDIIHSGYVTHREKVASLQFLAEKAALAGSPSAKALYDEAARELCLMAVAVRNQLDFSENPWNVSCSGGVFKAGDLILPQFSREIKKEGGKLLSPRFEPAEGAVLLAFKHFFPNGLPQIQQALRKE